MVKLTEAILSILESRRDEWSGEELKCIAEAVVLSEGIPEQVPIDPSAKTPQQILKDWMGD